MHTSQRGRSVASGHYKSATYSASWDRCYLAHIQSCSSNRSSYIISVTARAGDILPATALPSLVLHRRFFLLLVHLGGIFGRIFASAISGDYGGHFSPQQQFPTSNSQGAPCFTVRDTSVRLVFVQHHFPSSRFSLHSMADTPNLTFWRLYHLPTPLYLIHPCDGFLGSFGSAWMLGVKKKERKRNIG